MNATAMRLVRQALAATALGSSLVMIGCSDSPESLLGKARESISKNETKAAEIHLKNILQKGENAEARFLLGSLHLQGGDLRSAEKEFKRAQEAGFDAARLAVPLTDTLLQLGQAKEAIEVAGKTSPADALGKARLATLVGRANMLLGKPEAAKASFESALATQADYAPAQAGLATLQAATGDIKGASAAVDAVLARNPKSYEALTLKADLEAAQGNQAAAVDAITGAIAADPKDRTNRAKLVSILIEKKDYASAQKTLDELKGLTGPAPLTMHLQALIYANEDKPQKAREAIEVALRNGPDYLPAMALGARIYLQQGSIEQAERLARQVVDRAPESLIGRKLLASALLRMNSADKALQVLQPALAKGVKDPGLYALAGEVALRRNDAAKSAEYFEKGIQLDPKDLRAQTGLAFAHMASGNKAQGTAELERISALPDSTAQSDLALIAMHLRDRQFDKALAAIDRLESKQPDSAMAASLRGTALLGKNDPAGARKAFEVALARDPKSLSAAGSLANLDLRDKQPEAAKKRFTALLDKDPKNVEAMLAIAQLIQRTAPKSDKKAREEIPVWLKKAHETDKTSLPANLALAGWHMTNGQAKEAIPILQAALADKPDEVALLDALGVAYIRSDQATLGMETLEKILRVRPDDPALQMRMGQFKLARNDATGALVNFRRASELQPKAVEPRAAIAAALARQGKFDDARAIAMALQKEQPGNPAGPMLEGDIAMASRKFPDATQSYRKAVTLAKAQAGQQGGNAVLLVEIRLHQAILAAGNVAEADGMLRAMLKGSSDNLALRTYAAEHELSRQRWAEAIPHYEFILRQQPGNAIVMNNLAWALHEQKDPKALEIAEKALAAAPASGAVMDTVGVILVDTGKIERGIELMRQAVAASPKSASIRLHLAQALAKSGDKAGAKKEVETALKDAPEGPLAEKARALQKQL